jgi:hypothetical protein
VFVLVLWREGGLGFVYSYGGTSILFFFSIADFFLFQIWGGGGGPWPQPVPP